MTSINDNVERISEYDVLKRSNLKQLKEETGNFNWTTEDYAYPYNGAKRTIFTASGHIPLCDFLKVSCSKQ
ncbi:hypothetical protein HOE22_01715 [Candidatus Woesearchaeota archaeon]|nr:hypothetical protein [Candidatus Woesearchaeota archaeon]